MRFFTRSAQPVRKNHTVMPSTNLLDGIVPNHVWHLTEPSSFATGFFSNRRTSRPHRLSGIELEIIEGQRAAALLLVIMTFVHDTRPVPSAESAPGHGAGLTRRPDQFQHPRRMRLTDRISRNRGLSNGYRPGAVSAVFSSHESALSEYRWLLRYHRRKIRRRSQDVLRNFW
jgi:hypothetical protein